MSKKKERRQAMRYINGLIEPTTPEFLDWMANRLINVYGEKENVDFVIALRRKSQKIKEAIELVDQFSKTKKDKKFKQTCFASIVKKSKKHLNSND